MGKTKTNRDLANARRGVFASGAAGGGGGSAEPIDKRGKVEYVCSHCEPPRTFVQKDRYTQHVAKQHPEAGSPATAAPALSAPGPSVAGPSPATVVPGTVVRVTHKAPKTILQEFMQKAKRLVPKYTPRQAEGGAGWTCKVVLPDKYKPDSCVVMFMDDVAPSAEEATQRAAVVALAQVATNLPLERLLAVEYKDRFVAEGKKVEERQARAAAAAAAAARRKALADKPREKLAAVYMSDEKRKLVEEALQALRLEGGAGADGGGGGVWDDDGEDGEGDGESSSIAAEEVQQRSAALLPRLLAMGFQAEDAARALGASRSGSLNAMLEWLVLHLPEERLPKRFAAAAGQPIGVLRLAHLPSAADMEEGEDDGSGDGEDGDEPDSVFDDAAGLMADDDSPHALLYRRGYTTEEVAAVLGDSDAPPSSDAALVASFGSLLRASVDGDGDAGHLSTWPQCVAAGGEAGGAVDAAWREELQVLESIFGDRLQAATSAEDGTPCDEAVYISVDAVAPTGVTLHLMLTFKPLHARGNTYPAAPPLLAIHGDGLPPAAARVLTVRLAQAAVRATAQEEPCCYMLVSDLPDWVAELPVDAFATTAASRDTQVQHPSADRAAAPQQAAASRGAPAGAVYTAPSRRGAKGGAGGGRDPDFGHSPRARTAAQMASESASLAAALKAFQSASTGPAVAMRAARSRLPAGESRQDVVTAVAGHPVVVVSGETGCGKSTQVPQFILEAASAAGTGGECTILVTQPRRISAIGLAERVAAERCEPCGGVVGYSVRLESKRCAATRLLFCTTGVLLRRLLSDPLLEGVSHVVVDEVHERSLESDVALLLLRELLKRRPRLKLVLMSATADAALFAAYFASHSPATLTIPGFTHPVTDFYLEDVFERTGFLIGKASRYARRKKPPPALVDAETGEQVPAVFADDSDSPEPSGDGGEPEVAVPANKEAPASSGAAKASALPDPPVGGAPAEVPDSWDAHLSDAPTPALPAPAQRLAKSSAAADDDEKAWDSGGVVPVRPPGQYQAESRARADAVALAEQALQRYSESTKRSCANVDESIINFELLEHLVAHICITEAAEGPSAFLPTSHAGGGRAQPHGGEAKAGKGGAVLVFLPGVGEIAKAQRQLQRSRLLADIPLWVVPLHGNLSAADQREVFASPPPGVRKVVLATNVAETSVTIDDVRYVIDTGRHKEMRYDAARGLSRLEEDWCSGASGRQRRGRAGRTAPGAAFRLFTRGTAARMSPQDAPEMLRVPLEALCLRVKAMLPTEGLASVLGRAITPPQAASVTSALGQLRSLRALDGDERLTPLGQCLARMPVDARLGKMLLYGAVLGCLDPVLTIAGALSGRSLFVTPRDPEARGAADAAKAALACTAGKSDHVACVRAYDGWRAARAQGGRGGERAFVEDNALSWQALDAVRAAREDYASVLADLGFVDRQYVDHIRSDRLTDGSHPPLPPDVRAGSLRMVKAALCAGLYPNVVRVRHPEQTFAPSAGGAVAVAAQAKELRFYAREAGRVFLHPSSINFGCGAFESPWLVYSEAVHTAKVYIRECTMVPPYALLLFGGDIGVNVQKGTLSLDGWAEFEAPPKVAVLVRELRAGVDRLLASKVENPAMDLSQSAAVKALLALISSDGF
jgi:ATP-dependent RNA helicase DHX57